MIRALAFNPLNDETEFRYITTDFKVVDEFYIKTNVGPLLAGEVWQDTEVNRGLIAKIIERKVELFAIKLRIGADIHKLMNAKEKR